MKVTDVIAGILAEHVRHVFGISGGGDLHLIQSICARKDLKFICPQHEQGAAYAADAYARVNGLGVAVATSGPGATNLISGIASSYYDSAPVLYITGNQTRERLGIGLGVRQLGFQSTPIVEIVKPITKWAVTVMDEAQVPEVLRQAIAIAQTDRRGPVLIDLPDDVQRASC